MTIQSPFRRLAAAARAVAAGAVLASLVLAPAARAADASKEEMMPKSYTKMMKMKPVQVMHMMDADKKGYVTKEEFMKFYEDLFKRMDKNSDGKLTQPEFTDRG